MRTPALRRVFLTFLLPLAALSSRSGVCQTDTTTAADLAALEALYWARQDSARRDFTEADVRFMDGMIGHHAQALIMAALAPTNGASPAVRTLAARITNAQRDEIALMQRWLRDRGQPVPEVHIDGLTLMIHGGQSGHGGHGHDHAMMPGMLTDAQLQELAAAQGLDFDRLFLTYMIQHHRGAVTMVDELFATDGAAQDEAAFKLASDIHVDQLTEIARMQRMLDALPDPEP
ncbi:MAG TPA: DUF305 domain-containing protein [Rubricoccaceae bacterium]|nr:DUF305 domain-containing protein [Rubricoccaceae bacterium]